jgi:hypothetical protein
MSNIDYYSKYKKYKRKYILLQNGGDDFKKLLAKAQPYIEKMNTNFKNDFDKQFNLILKGNPEIKKFFESIKNEQTDEEIFNNLKLNADTMKALIVKLIEDVLAKMPSLPGLVAKAAQKTINVAVLITFNTLLMIFYDKIIQELKPSIMMIIDIYKKTHIAIKSTTNALTKHL